MMQKLTANLIGSQISRQVLLGKEYLVVPTVMINEGVHHGSDGPLYYPTKPLARSQQVWNHKPVVIRHPVDAAGNPISACTAQSIANQGVGMLLNTQWDSALNRLKTETWLDEARVKELEPSILTALGRGETVEVSTGLYKELDTTPGTWNNESYIGSVVDIGPDHLALLVGEKGACSIEDGAGLLRNSSGVSTGPNDVSLDDIREQARAMLREECDENEYCYILDVFKTYIIYETNGKAFQVGYTVKNGKVKLSDADPVEVRRVTSYVTANEVLVGNGNYFVFSLPKQKSADKISSIDDPTISKVTLEQPMTTPATTNNTVVQGAEPITQATLAAALAALNPQPAPARMSAIDQLIAAGNAQESDRTTLQNLSDHEFKAVASYVANRRTAPAVNHAPVAPVAPVPLQQYLQTAPPEVVEIVTNAIAINEQEKASLIAQIVANRNNRFSPEWLKTQKIPLLQGLAAMAGQAQPNHAAMAANYSGQAEVPMFLTNAQLPQHTHAVQEGLPVQPVLSVLS